MKAGIAMGNPLLETSIDLAVYVINLIDSLDVRKSGHMLDQLARCSTSIGANIHEAQHAESKRDFIHKLEIALKEAGETSYWLTVLSRTGRISDEQYREADNMCMQIRRLLAASCKTAKSKE